MRHPRRCRWLARALVCAAAASSANAQCATVPNTGCGPVTWCIGTTSVGQSFQVFCSVGGFFYVFLGACASTPTTIPVGIMCTAPCNFGVDLRVHVVYFVHGIAPISIPADPRLIGATLCVQCVPTPTILRCFQNLSSATRFTIVP